MHVDQIMWSNVGKNWLGHKLLAVWPYGEASRATFDEHNYANFVPPLADAEGESRATKTVDAPFAAMRDAMAPLHADPKVLDGLVALYVSSKTARGALDVIYERLIDAYKNDTSIRTTTDIPLHVMLLR